MYILYTKFLRNLIFCLAILLCGYYSPIVNLQSIGLVKNDDFIQAKVTK